MQAIDECYNIFDLCDALASTPVSWAILLLGGYLGAIRPSIVTGFVVDRTGSFLVALLIGAGMVLLLITSPITGTSLDAASIRLAPRPE